MSETDRLIRSQVAFCCDYKLVLNQTLVQDVQDLSLPHALKIAGPKNIFIHLVRPKTELNLDTCSCIFFGRGGGGGGIWPLEIFGFKNHHILIAILPPPSPSFARFCDSRISSY